MPQIALDDLIEIWKAFQDAMSENTMLKEGANRARKLMIDRSTMLTKLDEYEIQVGKLNYKTASYKEQINKLTFVWIRKEHYQEQARGSGLFRGLEKAQWLKQEKRGLSAKLDGAGEASSSGRK